MKRLLLFLFLSSFSLACSTYVIDSLSGASFEVGGSLNGSFFNNSDCAVITNANGSNNMTIYSIKNANSITYLNFSQNSTSASNETFIAPNFPKINRNLTYAPNQTFYNESYDLRITCNFSTRQDKALTYAENITLADGSTFSCPGFPGLNTQIDLQNGSTYQPGDARYNLTVRAKACNYEAVCNLPTATTLGWGQSLSFCGTTIGCQVAQNLLGENKTIRPSEPLKIGDYTVSCKKANLNWTVNYGANNQNEEYGVFCEAPPLDLTQVEFNLTQNLTGCNLSKTLNDGTQVCLDSVWTLCGDNIDAIKAIQKGDLSLCFDTRTAQIASRLESVELKYNQTQVGENSIPALSKKSAECNNTKKLIEDILSNYGMGMLFIGGIVYFVLSNHYNSRKAPQIPPRGEARRPLDGKDWGLD